jgi:prepilin signal peptidase PulO-like enzyme (type II secretory pathway)
MFFGFELELPLGAHILLAFIFGLAIGSFLNVMIHRVPRGETLALPASRCPTCRTPLKPYDNLPLLSYFLQHGRCRYCPALISPRYPLVEFLTALLFATLVWRNGLGWVVLLQMLFVAVMIALIFIDAEHQLLPDLITYPAYLLALAAAALQSGWGRELVVFSAPEQNTFPAGKAALYGGLILAGAAPSFFLLDVLDVLLFSRYFADEEQDEDGRQAESEELAETPVEIAREARRRLMVNASLALGIVLAAGWVWLYYFAAGQDTTVLEQAYRGLARAFVGA